MTERLTVGERVAERVRRDFPDPEVAAAVTGLLEDWGNGWAAKEVDRVQAAIVLSSAGDVDKLLALVCVAHEDYRDALMAAGFATGDWRGRMELAFRPAK
jgi:hypothetical protein